MDIQRTHQIEITKAARKGLEAAPSHCREKFVAWVKAVEMFGLEAVRQTASFHDEPLQGKRKQQRSIRLNKQWRAIYSLSEKQCLQAKPIILVTITVLEVTPHDYRTR